LRYEVTIKRQEHILKQLPHPRREGSNSRHNSCPSSHDCICTMHGSSCSKSTSQQVLVIRITIQKVKLLAEPLRSFTVRTSGTEQVIARHMPTHNGAEGQAMVVLMESQGSSDLAARTILTLGLRSAAPTAPQPLPLM